LFAEICCECFSFVVALKDLVAMAPEDAPLKKALITGITGQDGSYLTEFLLKKGYEVHGIIRRSSNFNTQRLEHIYIDPHNSSARMKLHYGDLSDASSLRKWVDTICPDEVYNLGAQSHVGVSFENPDYTADVVATGALRLLEAVRIHIVSTGRQVSPLFFVPRMAFLGFLSWNL